MATRSHDLIVVGANPAGLSLAIDAGEAGVRDVVVLEKGTHAVPASAVGRHAVAVEYLVSVERMADLDDRVELTLSDGTVRSATAVAVADIPPGRPLPPPVAVPPGLAHRVGVDLEGVQPGDDVLVVGAGERAVAFVERLLEAGCHVVLALQGRFEELSRLSQAELRYLERHRTVTVLFHTAPDSIESLDGLPMAVFEDRRTPDLVFDRIVYAMEVDVHDDPFALVGVTTQTGPDHVFILQDRNDRFTHSGASVVPAGTAWDSVREHLFPDFPASPPSQLIADADRIDTLRSSHYNATITAFEKANSDLWILRVAPDDGDAAHHAGQYATLGLGYWEPRIDSGRDATREATARKLIRRSYSISSPIFDEYGYLSDPHETDELEFYIVLVPLSAERVPALTPRLALKAIGDRIYLGPKIAGRYTLHHVRDPAATVLLLATGTGEAPHNAMMNQLLRRGHHGPIISVVSVRYESDLGYRDKHELLCARFDNVHYLPLPTREPHHRKVYIQDALRTDLITERTGVAIDPKSTHVYLCGNPAMIDPPKWVDGAPVFSGSGAIEVLVGRGFTPDRRGAPGNVHFEEYW